MKVYALVMDNPGHYVVGHATYDLEFVEELSWVHLQDAAHLMVTRGHCVLTPIDVLDVVHVSLAHYAGFGELNEEYRKTYEEWLELRRNPPSFEVEEGE